MRLLMPWREAKLGLIAWAIFKTPEVTSRCLCGIWLLNRKSQKSTHFTAYPVIEALEPCNTRFDVAMRRLAQSPAAIG
jgi:hypothetical protein